MYSYKAKPDSLNIAQCLTAYTFLNRYNSICYDAVLSETDRSWL